MKRPTLPVLFATLIGALFGIAAFAVIMHLLDRSPLNAFRPTARAAPLNYEELQRLNEKDAIAETIIPRLLASLEKDDEDVRLEASLALKKIGAPAVQPLQEKLRDANPKMRYCAAQSLAWIGPPAKSAASELVTLVTDKDAGVRRKSVYALGEIGVRTDAVLGALFQATDDKDEDVVETARETLKKFGPPPTESLDSLARLAKDSNHAKSVAAMKLLGQMGEPAVPVFKDLLKKVHPAERAELLAALTPLGKLATPLLPELETLMMKHKHWDAEEELLGTIKKCGSAGAASLTRVLKSLYEKESPHFDLPDSPAATLIKAIGEIGSEAKSAVPDLVEYLKEKEILRPAILTALGDIGPGAGEKAIEAVEALTTTGNIAAEARAALRRMGVIEKKK